MTNFEFRRVRPNDVAYCWPIYSEAMAPLVTGWNEPAQRPTIERALGEEGASIMVVDKSDAGWLHVTEQPCPCALRAAGLRRFQHVSRQDQDAAPRELTT